MAIPAVAATILILLVAAACGPAAPRVWKVGLIAPFEGAAYQTGLDALFAARLALREQHATEAHRFELVALDSGRRSGGVAARLAELATDPSVVGAVTLDENGGERGKGKGERGPLPLLSPFSFSLSPSLAEAIGRAAHRLSVMRLAVLGAGVSASAIDALSAVDAGLRVVGQVDDRPVRVPEGQEPDAAGPESAASVKSLLAGHPDGVLIAGGAGDLARSYSALARQGFAGPVFVLTPARLDDWAPIVPFTAALPVYWVRVETEPAEDGQFAARFRSIAGREPATASRLTYAAVRAMVQAADRQLRPSRPALAAALGAWQPPVATVSVERVLAEGLSGERIAIVPARR